MEQIQNIYFLLKYSIVLSIKVLSIAVFTIHKSLTISLLSRLAYLILKYLILLDKYKKAYWTVYIYKKFKRTNTLL